jgi:hypothetical protein
MGFDTFMSQTCPQVTAAPIATTAINLAAGYAAGYSGSMIVDSSAGILPGMFVTIAGDDTPLYVKTVADGTHITIGTPGLKRAVADNAVVTAWYTAQWLTTGYANGFAEPLVTDTSTVAPVTGQGMYYIPNANSDATLDTPEFVASRMYGAMEGSTITSLLLNRPLDNAMLDAFSKFEP